MQEGGAETNMKQDEMNCLMITVTLRPLSFCVFIEIRMHVVPTGSRQSVPASLALSLKEIYEYESTPQHSKKLRHTLTRRRRCFASFFSIPAQQHDDDRRCR